MRVADHILNEIYDHAAATYPEECCGLVVENGGQLQVIRAENKAPDPFRSFMVDPHLYLRYAKTVQFIYHSHPNASAKPSDADKASCERANVPFLVVSWPSGDMERYSPQGYEAPLKGRHFVYGIFDCFSIVRDYYQRSLGVALPEFPRPKFGWWKEDVSWIDKWYPEAQFFPVEDLEHGDMVIMRVGDAKVPNHVAVYLETGLILHHTLRKVSREEVYGGYWQKHTVKVVRHADRS